MADPTERECPYCKESIKAFAVICHYCQSGITPAAPSHGGECPFCGEAIKEDALKCRYCKSDLLTMSAQAEVITRSGLPTRDLLNCYQYCFFKYFGDDALISACQLGCNHHA